MLMTKFRRRRRRYCLSLSPLLLLLVPFFRLFHRHHFHVVVTIIIIINNRIPPWWLWRLIIIFLFPPPLRRRLRRHELRVRRPSVRVDRGHHFSSLSPRGRRHILFVAFVCVVEKVEKCEVFAREKEVKSCQTERRTRTGARAREREKKQKKNEAISTKTVSRSTRCKNGRVGYFVLFLRSSVHFAA